MAKPVRWAGVAGGMSAFLDRSLELILAHEGGWSDHAADRGGRTMFGITEGTFRTWSWLPGMPSDVRDLTQEQAREIYRRGYWDAAACDLLPWPVSYAQMDAAVQHGEFRARKWLQKGLGGITADGIIGSQSRAAIGRVGHWWRPLSRQLLHRADLYIRILRTPSQSAFAVGWANRLEDVVRICDRDTPRVEVAPSSQDPPISPDELTVTLTAEEVQLLRGLAERLG